MLLLVQVLPGLEVWKTLMDLLNPAYNRSPSRLKAKEHGDITSSCQYGRETLTAHSQLEANIQLHNHCRLFAQLQCVYTCNRMMCY